MPRATLPGGRFLEWTVGPHQTGLGRGVRLDGGRMSDRQAAPNDGVQVVNGLRFRAVRGELMLPGATFVDPVQEAKEAAAAAALSQPSEPAPSETTVATGPEAKS